MSHKNLIILYDEKRSDKKRIVFVMAESKLTKAFLTRGCPNGKVAEKTASLVALEKWKTKAFFFQEYLDPVNDRRLTFMVTVGLHVQIVHGTLYTLISGSTN